MKINVTKRNGTKEPLMLEKWQAQVAKICVGIADVSTSMVEIKSQLHFYDGITTHQIDEITLRAVVDLIDVENNPDVDEVWTIWRCFVTPALNCSRQYAAAQRDGAK